MNNFELEITLRCNSACPQCNRMCNVIDHGPSDMTIDQISDFIDSVRAAGGADIISVMGGEPTIHPEFVRIMEMLHNELELTGMVKNLRIATNGIIPIPDLGFPVKALVSPVARKQHRSSFIAPIDSGQKTRRCVVPWHCGMAINKFGYSPCGPASAIARLFEIDGFTRKEMPSGPEAFRGYEQKICPLCQLYAKNDTWIFTDRSPSPSYVEAFEAYLKRGGKPTKNLMAHLAAASIKGGKVKT